MVRPSYPGKQLPIGYVETQVGGVGRETQRSIDSIAKHALDGLLKENPGYRKYGGHRWASAQDGAGVWHWTLYVGAAPIEALSEPLDPRNLNAAPLPRAGDMDPTDGILPLGSRERKF